MDLIKLLNSLKGSVSLKSIPYLVILVLCFLLFFKDCSTKSKPITVTIPEVKGKFEPRPIVHKPIIIEKKSFGQILSKNDKSLKVNPIYIQQTDSLLKAYKTENDSLKTALYKKAIQLNNFNSSFEDEYLKLSINGIVRGEIKELIPNYTIKEKQVEIKPKEVKFRVLAGFEAGNTLLFDKPLFKANLGFQNAKGTILTVSYDTEQRFFVGYNFTVFNVK